MKAWRFFVSGDYSHHHNYAYFFFYFCPSIVHTRSLKQQYSYTEVVVERRVGNPPTILYKKLKGEKNDNIA